MNPRKERSSLAFVGVGHCLTASSLSGEIDTPFPLTNVPRNATCSLKKWHFLGLSFKLCSRKRVNYLRSADNVSSKSVHRTIMASRYTITSSQFIPRRTY